MELGWAWGGNAIFTCCIPCSATSCRSALFLFGDSFMLSPSTIQSVWTASDNPDTPPVHRQRHCWLESRLVRPDGLYVHGPVPRWLNVLAAA